MATTPLYERFAEVNRNQLDPITYDSVTKSDSGHGNVWDVLQNYHPEHSDAQAPGDYIAVPTAVTEPFEESVNGSKVIPNDPRPETPIFPRRFNNRLRIPTDDPPWFIPGGTGAGGIDFFKRIHEEICCLVGWLDPTPQEQREREKVAASVKLLSQSMWKECSVRAFGSFYTGLYLPRGDLDICLMNVPGNPKRSLKQLAIQLVECHMAAGVEVIANARVPIVKYVDRLSGIPVDISLNQKSALSTSKFIREQLARYPWLRPLIVVIKLYLQQRGLGETYRGGIGSYLLSIMVLSFLQQHRISRDYAMQHHASLGHLFFDFLQLYGVDFNYLTTGISVKYDGSYFKKFSRGWYYEERPMLLAAESPLEPEMDIGKNSYNIAVVRNAFRQTWQDLTELNAAWKGGKWPPSQCLLARAIYSADPIFTRIRPWPLQEFLPNGYPLTGENESDGIVGESAMPVGQLRPIPKVSKAVVSQVKSNIKLARSKGPPFQYPNPRHSRHSAEADQYLKRGTMTANVSTSKRVKVETT